MLLIRHTLNETVTYASTHLHLGLDATSGAQAAQGDDVAAESVSASQERHEEEVFLLTGRLSGKAVDEMVVKTFYIQPTKSTHTHKPNGIQLKEK